MTVHLFSSGKDVSKRLIWSRVEGVNALLGIVFAGTEEAIGVL